MSPTAQKTESNSGGDGAGSITAADIAARLSGELIGDGLQPITGIAALDRAGSRDVSLMTSAKYSGEYQTTGAGVVLILKEFRDLQTAAPARVVVQRPLEGILSLLPDLYPENAPRPGIHQTAVLATGVRLGDGVSVGPYSVIGAGAVIGDNTVVGPHCVIGERVSIGRDCRLFPSVTIYDGSVLGDQVTLHAGVRIGSDGFGYLPTREGHQKIRHVGRCIIGDNVEIGANSCIDRGSIGDTIIGEGTKIDNLVHIGHNVRVGKRVLILAQVGIAGSCRIHDDAVLAGQVGVAGHITIGKGAKLAAQAGVISDIPPGETWSGFPARPHREVMRGYALLFKLGGMTKKLEKLLGEEK